MTNDEKLVIEKREIACKEAVNSLINLVNAITEERNYYHNHCSFLPPKNIFHNS